MLAYGFSTHVESLQVHIPESVLFLSVVSECFQLYYNTAFVSFQAGMLVA